MENKENSLKEKLDIEAFGFDIVNKFNNNLPGNLIFTLFLKTKDFDNLFESLEMFRTNPNEKINEFKYNSSSGISFVILRKL